MASAPQVASQTDQMYLNLNQPMNFFENFFFKFFSFSQELQHNRSRRFLLHVREQRAPLSQFEESN